MTDARLSDAAGGDAPGVTGWLALALLCGSAILSAVLELLFLAEFYAGTVIVPVVVLAALVGNVLLPVLGFQVIRAVGGAVLPIACWLVTILGLALYTRPEGDLLVIDGFHQQGAFYGLLLTGAIAGFTTSVIAGGRDSRRPPPPSTAGPPNRPDGSNRRGGSSSPGGPNRPGGEDPRVNR